MVLISCFSPLYRGPNNLALTRHQGVKALSPEGQVEVPKNHINQGARQEAKAGDRIHTPGTERFLSGSRKSSQASRKTVAAEHSKKRCLPCSRERISSTLYTQFSSQKTTSKCTKMIKLLILVLSRKLCKTK